MKTPSINQIVDTIRRAYNITEARQYNINFIKAIGECRQTQFDLAANHDHIAGEKRALTVWNNMLADELDKLYNAQTEDEIDEITNDIRSYCISRASSKQKLKFYRDTERIIMNNGYAAYRELLKHYQEALDMLENKKTNTKADTHNADNSELYTLTRKEAVDLLSHITKALTSNKDEQTFLLDMSHYKK